MPKWIKPSGAVVKLNDNPDTVAAAKALGWKLKPEKPAKGADAPDTDARGLPWDERLNTKNKARDDAGNWKYKPGMTAAKAAGVETGLLAAKS